MNTAIIHLLFCAFFALAAFFFVFCVVQFIKNKKDFVVQKARREEKNRKRFKVLLPVRKSFIVAEIIFFAASVFLQNIIFAL
ncbi:MAG: hypothetical protein LBO62_00270, partial [Endomicrobium sp.]|nr:hypothetical protein [Endomicrobium sp.]